MLEFVICLNMVLTALANLCALNGMSSPEEHQIAYVYLYNYVQCPCIGVGYARVDGRNLKI